MIKIKFASKQAGKLDIIMSFVILLMFLSIAAAATHPSDTQERPLVAAFYFGDYHSDPQMSSLHGVRKTSPISQGHFVLCELENTDAPTPSEGGRCTLRVSSRFGSQLHHVC